MAKKTTPERDNSSLIKIAIGAVGGLIAILAAVGAYIVSKSKNVEENDE